MMKHKEMPDKVGSTGWITRPRRGRSWFRHKSGWRACSDGLGYLFNKSLVDAKAVRVTLYRKPRKSSVKLRTSFCCDSGCYLCISSRRTAQATQIKKRHTRNWPAAKKLYDWLKARGSAAACRGTVFHAVLETR
jgi:hypothetical protein